MINILIVEDDKAISNLIKLTVKRTGFFCDTAYDGEAALEKINEKKFDLILLDIIDLDVLEYHHLKWPTCMKF